MMWINEQSWVFSKSLTHSLIHTQTNTNKWRRENICVNFSIISEKTHTQTINVYGVTVQ